MLAISLFDTLGLITEALIVVVVILYVLFNKEDSQ